MLGQALRVPVHRTSHQIGHILAALYSAGAMHLLQGAFLAFHVSGGTTDCVLCEPDAQAFMRITPVSTSLDLKAGQAIDRVGVMLGLPFPCGPALEALAVKSTAHFRYKPTMKGNDCCLSGLENQCRRAHADGMSPEDTAALCLTAIGEVLREMTVRALAQHGDLPVLYAGGVMADLYLREHLTYPGAHFAAPAFSCDNAAGTALYAALCTEGERLWQS